METLLIWGNSIHAGVGIGFTTGHKKKPVNGLVSIKTYIFALVIKCGLNSN
jgi:hypothetical protein